MKDISDLMRAAGEAMRAQIASKADLLDPIRARFRAMDLTSGEIALDLTYDEVQELTGGFSWLPTLAHALGIDREAAADAGVTVSDSCVVTLRGPGLADWPITFGPLD